MSYIKNADVNKTLVREVAKYIIQKRKEGQHVSVGRIIGINRANGYVTVDIGNGNQTLIQWKNSSPPSTGQMVHVDWTNPGNPLATTVNGTFGWLDDASNSADQASISGSADLTDCSITFTAGPNRKILLSYCANVLKDGTGGLARIILSESDNTTIDQRHHTFVANEYNALSGFKIVTPTAGSITYKLRASSDTTTITVLGTNATNAARIMAQDIGANQ